MKTSLKRYPSYKDSGSPWWEGIPSNWDVIKLKYISIINRQTLPENTPLNLIFDYVDIGGVTQNKITTSEEFIFSKAPSRARRIACPGDTIIATVRTYLKAIAHVDQDCSKKIYSTGFAIIEPHQGINSKFLTYCLQSDGFVNQVVSSSKGISYPAITASELGDLLVLKLPMEEQNRCVDFLDNKSAELDHFISKKEKLIDMLKEQKTILINRAVTQGLDPKAIMSDSNIPWIGKIPEHWEIKRAKYIFREIDERSTNGDEELLSVSHMTGVTPRSEKNVNMFMSEDYSGAKVCRNGDLVINIMWAWMGALGVSDRTGLVSPSYAVYRQAQHVFTPWFLENLLRSRYYVAEYNRRSTGLHSSRLRLYATNFLDMSIGIPGLAEQLAIQDTVLKQTSEIDLIVSRTEEEISKLKELRQVLISEVVTGKIKVLED